MPLFHRCVQTFLALLQCTAVFCLLSSSFSDGIQNFLLSSFTLVNQLSWCECMRPMGQFCLRTAVIQLNPVRLQIPALYHESSLKQEAFLPKGSCSIRIFLYHRGHLRILCFFNTSLNTHATYVETWTNTIFLGLSQWAQMNVWLKLLL